MFRKTAFFAEINCPVWLIQPCDPAKNEKNLPFHLHGGDSAGSVSTPWDLGTGLQRFMLMLELASVPFQTYVRVHDARQSIFGMKCVGSQRATGWTWFLPIPAFQWRSYFGVMLYKVSGTAERNTTQLEEMGAWHIWHCMRSCSQK